MHCDTWKNARARRSHAGTWYRLRSLAEKIQDHCRRSRNRWHGWKFGLFTRRGRKRIVTGFKKSEGLQFLKESVEIAHQSSIAWTGFHQVKLFRVTENSIDLDNLPGKQKGKSRAEFRSRVKVSPGKPDTGVSCIVPPRWIGQGTGHIVPKCHALHDLSLKGNRSGLP